jgi:hypothetical protein
LVDSTRDFVVATFGTCARATREDAAVAVFTAFNHTISAGGRAVRVVVGITACRATSILRVAATARYFYVGASQRAVRAGGGVGGAGIAIVAGCGAGASFIGRDECVASFASFDSTIATTVGAAGDLGGLTSAAAVFADQFVGGAGIVVVAGLGAGSRSALNCRIAFLTLFEDAVIAIRGQQWIINILAWVIALTVWILSRAVFAAGHGKCDQECE